MLTSTLGGLIKDYRLKKRLSQLEVSLRIGWSDTTRLSKIEQGRVGKPTRETVEKIIKALELTEQEKGEFLFMGGYLPTDDEIKKVIREVSSKIDDWQYPAYLMDFSWRFLYCNEIHARVFEMYEGFKKDIEKTKPNVLELPFVSKDILKFEIEKGEDETKLKPFKVAAIASFKVENMHYQNETWYKKIVQNLMKYGEFRKLWPKIDLRDYHKKLSDYEFKRSYYGSGKKRLEYKFHLYTTRVINDPRFQITLYFPADEKTKAQCAKISKLLDKI